MKKIIIPILLFILVFTLSACKKNNETLPLDWNKIYDVIDHISLLPDEITLNDEEKLNEARSMYEELNADEKKLVSNLLTLESKESEYNILKETKDKADLALENAFLEAQEYLLNYVPNIIEENITLPRTYNSSIGEIAVLWSSSNQLTLSNSGVTNPGRKITTLTLTTTLRYQNETYSFNKKVKVEKVTFATLPKKGLTFAYMYNRGSFSQLRPGEELTLDVVNYAFGRVKDGLANLSELTNYQNVLALRKQGIRVVLSLGGYEDAAVPFSDAAKTEKGRETLARSIVEAIEQYHFDGVDIDWEYPGFYTGTKGGISDYVIDSANYTALIKEIKHQLKLANPDYILSAATPGGPYSTHRFELENLASLLDYFHLMTYDMDSANVSTHLTPLYSSSNGVNLCSVHDTVNNYLAHGVPKEKLVVGIAFYARKFYLSPSATKPMKENAISRETAMYAEIVNTFLSRVESGEVIRYFDNVAKAPYLFDTENKIAVTYEDAESIMYKSQYTIDNGLAGVMFWEYGEDTTGILMEAIYTHYVKNN